MLTAVRELPLLGSNQDSPDPESGVLPITPRGSALDFFCSRSEYQFIRPSRRPQASFPHRFWGRDETLPYRPGPALRSTRSPAALVLLHDNAESSAIPSTAHSLPNGKARGPTHRPAQSPWPATPAHRP